MGKPPSDRFQITLPNRFPSGTAEVIVLAKQQAATAHGMSLREYSAWIRQQPADGLSREAIDSQSAEERDA